MPLAATFLSSVVLSLKNVGTQEQTPAVTLLLSAGEHHVQAPLADGLQQCYLWGAMACVAARRLQRCAC